MSRQNKQMAAVQPKQPNQVSRRPRRNRVPRSLRNVLSTGRSTQVGSVISPVLTQLGIADIRRLTIGYVTGYSFVGNGTNGAANSVYFLPYSSGTPAWLIKGNAAGSSGTVPVLPSDSSIGATWVNDLLKHFARIKFNKVYICIDSLQPSTSNNMMIAIAPYRGSGISESSVPITFATAVVAANTIANVTSMKGAIPVGSWESKRIDATSFIAGGGGSMQNELKLLILLGMVLRQYIRLVVMYLILIC